MILKYCINFSLHYKNVVNGLFLAFLAVDQFLAQSLPASLQSSNYNADFHLFLG